MSNIGVLLLQMGGPDTPEAVQPFLRNLFTDRDLIQLRGLDIYPCTGLGQFVPFDSPSYQYILQVTKKVVEQPFPNPI